MPYIAVFSIPNEKDIYNAKNLFIAINNPTKNVQQFGLLETIGIDMVRTIFGFKG